jgi:hypothetical protein
MTDRIPLIVNTGAAQIQELANGDGLLLTNSNIVNAGAITANSVSVPEMSPATTSLATVRC